MKARSLWSDQALTPGPSPKLGRGESNFGCPAKNAGEGLVEGFADIFNSNRVLDLASNESLPNKCGLAASSRINRINKNMPTEETKTSRLELPAMPPELMSELVAELVKRGATMEDIARLKDPGANSPTEALQALKTGNTRFYSGTPQRTSLAANERRAQIMSQTPFAVVLGCADSRVPVELIFDQGPGDIFGIRIAGNVVEPGTLGSIEYAIKHLKVYLVVILGHEGCGAVTAAMMDAAQRDLEPENVRFLLDRIVPAVCDLPILRDTKSRMREAVVRNVHHQIEQLSQNPVVNQATSRGQIEIIGAFYEIGSGAVDFLES